MPDHRIATSESYGSPKHAYCSCGWRGLLRNFAWRARKDANVHVRHAALDEARS